VSIVSKSPPAAPGGDNFSRALTTDIAYHLALLRWPVLATGWLAGALSLAPSIYMLEVYGRVVNARSDTTLVMLSMAIVGAFVLLEILDWLRNRMLQRGAHALDALWAERLFESSLGHQLVGKHSQASQLLSDWRTSLRFVTSPAFQGLLDAPVALLFLAAVFLISPILGVFTLGGAGLQFIVALITERSTHAKLKEANKEGVMAAQLAEDTLRNAQVLASMGMANRLQSQWLQRQHRAVRLQAEASAQAGTAAALSRAIQNTVSSGLLGLGCWLLLNNDLNGGPAMMIVASILGGRVMAPLLQVITQWSSVVNARLAWQRLHVVLVDSPVPGPLLPLPRPEGRVSVENVVAGIPGQSRFHPVLTGVGFQLSPGNVLAVVGPSASGKSTLGRLLVGLWPAQQGAVRLNGFDIFEWNKDEVGAHLGYLPQEVQLLPGTIAENISRFGQGSREQVERAAQQVGLHEVILALPKAYDTWVDDASLLLSGGQRQRLALATALFGNPALVVLDEPNSSLDDAGDAVLAVAIRSMSAQGTTFVVITHRTRILDVATHILILVNGKAQAFGPRDEVLAAMAKAAAPTTRTEAATA
jgi:ATP-binding cassette, subfamily C, bacterial exporter for protease/lipase